MSIEQKYSPKVVKDIAALLKSTPKKDWKSPQVVKSITQIIKNDLHKGSYGSHEKSFNY